MERVSHLPIETSRQVVDAGGRCLKRRIIVLAQGTDGLYRTIQPTAFSSPSSPVSGSPSVPLSLTTYTQRNKDVMNKEKGVKGNLFSRRIGGRRFSG